MRFNARLGTLGRQVEDAATAFVVVLVVFGMLAGSSRGDVPPPESDPETIVVYDEGDSGDGIYAAADGCGCAGDPPRVGIVRSWDIVREDGRPPKLKGKISFSGEVNASYYVLLVAMPVSTTIPDQPVYTILKKITVTTDGNGDAAVTFDDLKGVPPLATAGWYGRILLAGVGEVPGEWQSPKKWIPVTDDP